MILSVDSGVGGLSIVAEVRALLPDLGQVYLCDNAFYPYGTKDGEELLRHFLAVMRSAIEDLRPQLIVTACNTISTICLPGLRAFTQIPVVGVVPAIKPAAAMSKKRVIGLLATPATVNRSYTQDLIDQFAKDCTILRIGSSALVDMAEVKLRGEPIDARAVSKELGPFFDRPETEQPDVVVMACTHFPLLKQELSAAGPSGVDWIDSGAAIARRVRDLLAREMQTAGSEPPPSPSPNSGEENLALVTGELDPKLESAFRRYGFERAEMMQATPHPHPLPQGERGF